MKIWGCMLLFMLVTQLRAADRILLNEELGSPEIKIMPSAAGQIDLEIRFPDLILRDTSADYRSFQYLEMGGLGSMRMEGLPQLPQTTRLVGIDPRGGFQAILISGEFIEREQVDVYPVQPQPTRDNTGSELVMNEEFYRGDQWYPEQMIQQDLPAIWREIRVLPVSIHPVQYNPALKKIKIARVLRFRVERTVSPGSNELPGVPALSRTYVPLYRSFIENYPALSSGLFYEIQGLPDMLIVTHDEFYNAVAPFAEWKREKGVATVVVRTSEIGPNPTSSQIQTYISNYYQAATDKPDYLLIVGDVTGTASVPWFSVGGSMTDLPYYLLVGSDILPDISGGRISVRTVAEATTVFTKLIRYEKEPYSANSQWFHRALVINSSDFQDPTAGLWAKNRFLAYGYDPVFHLGDNLGNATSTNVSNAVNTGISYLYYIGHGSGTSWGTTGFSTSHIPNLVNGEMQPVISSVACNNADLDEPYDCFAEVWLKNNLNKGSVGVMAFTESCSAYEPDTLARGMVRALLSDTLPAFGNIIDYGRMHMFQAFGTGCSPAMYQSLLVGEPELQVWTRTPQDLLVTMPPIAYFNTPVTIQVSDLHGAVKGALVCYSDTLGNYVRGFTDTNGQLVLDHGVSAPVIGKITISRHNYLPYQRHIEIIPPNGPYVLVSNLVPHDSLGNNNGIIESGEQFPFELTLRNIGIDPANQIQVRVISRDTNFVILKDTTSFGSLPPGDTLTGGHLEGWISASCPHRQSLAMEIQISADGGHSWNQSYWIEVSAGARIVTTPDSLHFPDTFVNFMSEMSLTVNNPGMDTLWIHDITTSLPQFRVNTSPLAIAPGGEQAISVQFLPDSVRFLTGEIRLHNSDPLQFYKTVLINGEAIYAPDIETGDSLYISALVTDSLNREIIISNTGPGELRFTLQVAGYRPGQNVGEGTGGADTFGHIWVDSDEPTGPIFDWMDISAIGTVLALTGNNSVSQPVPIGFPFSFYGNDFTQFRVCSNGWISFSTFSVSYHNLELPDLLAPRNLIAPLWDDLNMTTDSRVLTENLGNKVVILFQQFYRVTGEGPFTFEVVLYDNGNILYQYLNLPGLIPDYTVGIQNHDALDGLTIAHDEPYLKDSLAVLISKHSWLTVEPAGGMVPGNEQTPLTLTIKTSNFPLGDFWAGIQIESNDPDEPLVVIPVHLEVGITGLETEFAAVPTSLELAQNYPNPFNPSTTISYVIPEAAPIEIAVYNLLGQRLKILFSGIQKAGRHQVSWDGTNDNGNEVASGLYLYYLKTPDRQLVRKMFFLK